ncbi:MAG: hypothetical protein ACOC1F_10730, partial [Myxococcota bacterium]
VLDLEEVESDRGRASPAKRARISMVASTILLLAAGAGLGFAFARPVIDEAAVVGTPGVKRFTRMTSVAAATQPRLSPDGTWFVFVAAVSVRSVRNAMAAESM